MASQARVELHRGKNDDWYWRRVAGNNRKVAGGGEGYRNYGEAFSRACDEASAHGVEVVIVEKDRTTA